MAGVVSGSTPVEGAASGSPSPAASALRPFKLLFYASGLGIVLFAGIWAVLGMTTAQLFEAPILRGILVSVGAGAFLMAIFICPIVLIAAVVGALITFLRRQPGT